MIQRALLTTLLAAFAADAAPVRFVTPLDGARVWGEQWIEVEVDLPEVDRVEIRVDGSLVGILREPPFRLPHDFGDSGKSFRLTADAFAESYARHEHLSIRTAPLEASESITIDWVEVPILFRGDARPSSADVRLIEDGTEQAIEELTPTRGPTRFVFVLDRSLSMRDGLLDSAIDAVRRIHPRLRPDDEAAVIFFNHRVSVAVPVEGLEPAEPSGGTALRDALASIQPDGRTIAIVISDGGDRNSLLRPEEAIARVAVENLSVHALALRRGEGADFLHEAAQRTGGTFRLSSQRDLPAHLQRIFDDIDARWTLSYQSRNHGRGWRSIDVEPLGRNVEVISVRKGYFAE